MPGKAYSFWELEWNLRLLNLVISWAPVNYCEVHCSISCPILIYREDNNLSSVIAFAEVAQICTVKKPRIFQERKELLCRVSKASVYTRVVMI